MRELPEENRRSVPAEIVNQIEPLVGAIVINHAFVEVTIEMCLTALWDETQTAGFLKKYPIGIENKTQYLRDAGNNLDRIECHRSLLNGACHGAERLSNLRHIVVHGVLTHCFMSDDPTVVFMRLDRKDALPRERLSDVPMSVLADAANVAGDIVRDFQQLCRLIVGE
ncbi:MAG: hypothetical protein AAF742_06130 [Pseudomonadota bacterium]